MGIFIDSKKHMYSNTTNLGYDRKLQSVEAVTDSLLIRLEKQKTSIESLAKMKDELSTKVENLECSTDDKIESLNISQQQLIEKIENLRSDHDELVTMFYSMKRKVLIVLALGALASGISIAAIITVITAIA